MATTTRLSTAKPRRRRKPAKTQASNARLLKLAKTHRPPQEWFDQIDCPFPPAKS